MIVGMRPLHLAGSPSGPSRGCQGPDRWSASLDVSLPSGNQMKLFFKIYDLNTHPRPRPPEATFVQTETMAAPSCVLGCCTVFLSL